MLIDTHCHLDFPEFEADRDAVLATARAAGVEALINIGSSLEGSRRGVALSERYPQVYASVGIHPHDAKDCDEKAFAEIAALASHKKVLAIGEIGLDYFRNLSTPGAQRDVFVRFLKLAAKVGKPAVIHCRDAEEETLGILESPDGVSVPGIVVHCFSGSQDFLKRCLDLGFFVSFTANITYKKAAPLRALVKQVPLERMFLETDAPFLPPEGKRGRRNEPAGTVDVAREVARIRETDFDVVCSVTTENARHFFHMDEIENKG